MRQRNEDVIDAMLLDDVLRLVDCAEALEVRKALLAHPLIGQDEMARALVERLLQGEPVP